MKKPVEILCETVWEFGTNNLTQRSMQVMEYQIAMESLAETHGNDNVDVYRDRENNKLLYFLK